MNEPHLHRRPDRLLRTGGYILLFLLCAGALYAINWALRGKVSKPYLRITFTKIELEDDGNLRVRGTGEYTTPIRITDFETVEGTMGGLCREVGRGESIDETHRWTCPDSYFWWALTLLEITRSRRHNPEFDPSDCSILAMATCGHTYELHPGDSLTICRVRGKSRRVYERRIEVNCPGRI